MPLVGEAVPDRNAGELGQLLDGLLGEAAEPDPVKHSAQDPRGVRDGLGQRGLQAGAGLDVEVGAVGAQRPDPDLVPVQVRVGHERVRVDHGQHGVEVHGRPGVRQFDGQDQAGLPGREQGPGQVLDAGRGGPLAHPDGHHAGGQDMDVAALEGGREVLDVVVAVPERELRVAEPRVEPVDGPWC